jgi:hypothetical protein
MKRRVIYLTDEQWADLQAQARGERTTISNLIRHGMALVPNPQHAEDSPVEFHARRFNSRPFTPVPKKAR